MNKSAQNDAQKVAKQIAREPFEILNNVSDQLFGDGSKEGGQELSPQAGNSQRQTSRSQAQNQSWGEDRDKQTSDRLIEAYKREIDDIRKQNLLKNLQAKISRGDEIPLDDYHELGIEEKQVLKAQMEAYRIRKSQAGSESFQEVPVVRSKPSRRFGAGQKHEAEKQQTRVEKPIPPSG